MKRGDDSAVEGVLTRFFAAEMPADLPAPPLDEPATYAPIAAARRGWRAPTFVVVLSLGGAACWLALRPTPAWAGPVAEVPADIVPLGFISPVVRTSSRTDRVGDRDVEYTIVEGSQSLGLRAVETEQGWMAEEATVLWTEVSCMLPDSGVQLVSTIPALRISRQPWPDEWRRLLPAAGQ